MPNQTIQVDYDQLKTIAKKFNGEGEDITQLHSDTRRRVRDLYKEWEGEAADKFFDEMETELLPALERLAYALFYSQDVTNKIMKIFNEGDTETASYFKGDLDRTDDFGAGQFNSALGGVSGGSPAPEDFGAGKFEEALPGQGENQPAPGQGTGQAGSSQSGDGQQQGQTAGAQSAGGGGGGGGGSQGSQGDLKGLGESLGGQPQQTTVVGGSSGGAGQNMPDHVYGDGSAGQSDGGSQQGATGDGSGGSNQAQAGGAGSLAAGAAGIAGTAAAGGAAKVLKDKKDNDG